MTLCEEYAQRRRDAEKFYNRLDELEYSIREFIGHIEKINKSKYRSRAEVLSAVKKLSFELDGVIEEATNYSKTTSNLLLLPTGRTLSPGLSLLISESLPSSLKVASEIIGNIDVSCYCNPQELNSYAEGLDKDRDPLLETLQKQIATMQSTISSLTSDYASMTDKQIVHAFEKDLARYDEEESKAIDYFIDDIIDIRSGKADLREQYRENNAVIYYQRKSNPHQFIISLRNSESDDEDDNEYVFIESELIPVFDYISKNRRLKQIANQEKSEQEQENNYSLIRFVFNDQEREKVIQGLQSCEDTGQVATFAKTLYNEEILSLEILRSADFHRTILPLLKFKATENAIKQAISKQVQE